MHSATWSRRPLARSFRNGQMRWLQRRPWAVGGAPQHAGWRVATRSERSPSRASFVISVGAKTFHTATISCSLLAPATSPPASDSLVLRRVSGNSTEI